MLKLFTWSNVNTHNMWNEVVNIRDESLEPIHIFKAIFPHGTIEDIREFTFKMDGVEFSYVFQDVEIINC
jgi:hypothetical protein